jgi:aspartate 1-decarboxylase
LQRQMLKSKIHRATVTECDGARFVTHATEGEPGSAAPSGSIAGAEDLPGVLAPGAKGGQPA